jgi:hypothetical protein
MNDFAQDPLARRLRELDITTPDASRVAAAALDAQRRPARAGQRALVIALTLVPLVTVIITAITAYFAPAFSQALADAPIAGRVAGPVLRQFGLASIEHRVTSFGDRSTSSGYTVELVAGYADSSRTVLFLRATPAAWIEPTFAEGLSKLRDQFGREYLFTSGTANSATGDAAFTFAPIAGPASQLGARLTLTVARLEDRSAAQGAQAGFKVEGRWEMHGTLLPAEGQELALPEPGALDGASFVFTKVRALPAALLIEGQVTGASAADLAERIPDGLKGRPVFTTRLLDATGRERQPLSIGCCGSKGVTFGGLWEITRPGTYQLVLTWEGRGTLSRTVVVP